MKKILWTLALALLVLGQAWATIPVGTIPVTKQSVPNQNQASDFTDTVGVSANVGVPFTVQGNAVCTTGSVCPGYQTNLSINPGTYINGGICTYSSAGNKFNCQKSSSGIGSVTSITLASPNSTLSLSGTNPITGAGTINLDFNLATANIWTGKQVFNTANVGIGTTLSTNRLDVASNVAIGATYAGYQSAPSNGLIVQGNVGLGTVVPPNALYVNGTMEGKGFKLDGNGVGSGYVLTSNSVGVGTWMPATGGSGGSSQWTGTIGSNLYYSGANVGIGTSLSANTLDVATNVSIGTTYAGYTAAPANGLIVQGNVGIGTSSALNTPLTVNGPIATLGTANTYLNASGGNVGIGSTNPGQILDVNGAIRSTVAGNSIFNGNVGIGTTVVTSLLKVGGSCAAIGPVGACWTATGQAGYCSGAAGACTTCTAC